MNSATWILIGVLSTLAAIILRVWVPQAIRAKIRRAGAVIGSDEVERPSVPEEMLPPPPPQALQQKDVHDELLRDAVKLLNLARANDDQSLRNLETADEKLAEALLLRPDAFEARRLQADVAMARAGLVAAVDRVAAHEQAAARFEVALELRKGVPDLYIGLAWSWLGVMQHDDSRLDAPSNALAAFTAGHATSRGNLWIIKGWGTVVDVMVRRQHADAAAALAQYERALGLLSGPAAMAGDWFAELRTGAGPSWLPVPPLRDV